MSKTKDTKFDRHTEINTAFIVSELANKEKDKYNKEVFQTIIDALEHTICDSNGYVEIELSYYGTKEQYQKEHPEYKYSFPHYFCWILHGTSEDKMVVYSPVLYVYDYSQPCILSKEDGYFNFFFALYFSMIDESQAKEFLKYHYRYNYQRDFKIFSDFLIQISYDYPDFLSDNYLLAQKNLDKIDALLSAIIDNNNTIPNLSTQINNDISKPTFKPEVIEQIFDFLKNYFPAEQQPELKKLLSTGCNTQSPLLFKGNGNRLANAFKQLIEADIITGYQKIELEYWIAENFNYLHRKEIKQFKPKYLNDIISTSKDKCRKPLFIVSSDKRIINKA